MKPETDRPEATVHFKAAIPRFASKAGKRIFAPLNALNPFSDVPPAIETRQHPVVVRIGYVEEDRTTILLPAGFTVESMPTEPVSVESAYGKYSLKTSLENGVVRVERRLEILPVYLPAEAYGPWRDFYKEIANMDGAKLVLVQAPNVAQGGGKE